MRYRREFLGAFALAAVGTAGCTSQAGDPPRAQTSDDPTEQQTPVDCKPPNRTRDLTLLGDFETGLDGWATNGGHELTRVTGDEVPAGVVSGEHALAVEVKGDAAPTIANEDRVSRADFANKPYLQLHVLAVATGTDSDLVFRFRLHHAAGCGGGGNGSPASEDANVEESKDVTVPQLYPRLIQWDMTELPEDVLATASWLEIRWTPVDGEPIDTPSGTASGTLDYRQLVVFDDVRLSTDEPISDADRLQQKRMDLHREHGMIVERVFEEQTETVERGTIEYADGYVAEYAFEELDGGRFRYTLDGETFVIGNRSK